ncbi:MAG TPA: CheR family methyltransferase [Candidatus Binatia bacterium]|jgi:two-component system CheB/CheR fusion protein
MSDGDDLESEDVAADEALPPDPTFTLLLEKLHTEHNFDFRQYKEASLQRRIKRRMSQVHVSRFDEYAKYLDQHAGEHAALLDVILINVTRFFRDAEAWGIVRDRVLPSVIREAAGTRMLRFWSAGCSSGEETYSLAILLAEALGEERDRYDVKIYATDIDEDALTTARAGLYRLEQLKDVDRQLADRYFFPDGQAFRIRRDVRKWCIFGRHDLTQDAPLSHIDLLICRNVLIYFDSDLQARLLPRFQYATRNDGYLFLGRSESLLSRSRRVVPVDFKWRIFQRITPSGDEGGVPALLREERNGHAFRPRDAARAEQPPVFAAILDSLSAALVVIDPSETIVTWNAAAETVFEIPADSALGKKFRDLDISYRIEGLRARVEEVRNTHARSEMADVVFARRSGDMMHVNLGILALSDAEGHFGGVLVMADDISEHGRLRDELDRQTEQSATANEELQSTNEELETTNEELQSTNEELETTNEELQSTNEELEATVEELQSTNSELGALNGELERRTAELNRADAFQRGVLDGLHPGLFVLDPDFNVTHWNNAAARIWGLRTEAAVGREFFSLPIGEVARLARDPLHRVKETRNSERLPAFTYALPGGEQRRAALEMAAILSPIGELLGILGMATDMGTAEPGRA